MDMTTYERQTHTERKFRINFFFENFTADGQSISMLFKAHTVLQSAVYVPGLRDTSGGQSLGQPRLQKRRATFHASEREALRIPGKMLGGGNPTPNFAS